MWQIAKLPVSPFDELLPQHNVSGETHVSSTDVPQWHTQASFYNHSFYNQF